jgi:hypothetical protein
VRSDKRPAIGAKVTVTDPAGNPLKVIVTSHLAVQFGWKTVLQPRFGGISFYTDIIK